MLDTMKAHYELQIQKMFDKIEELEKKIKE